MILLLVLIHGKFYILSSPGSPSSSRFSFQLTTASYRLEWIPTNRPVVHMMFSRRVLKRTFVSVALVLQMRGYMSMVNVTLSFVTWNLCAGTC